MSIGIKCAPGVVGPAEADIDFDIIKNDNDTFTVKYTPPGAGHYTIMVLFANQVPQPTVIHSHKAYTVEVYGDNWKPGLRDGEAQLHRRCQNPPTCRQHASQNTSGLFQRSPLPTLGPWGIHTDSI